MRGAGMLAVLAVLAGCGAAGRPIAPGSGDVMPVVHSATTSGTTSTTTAGARNG
ncbi:hypothetical protein ABIE69_001660 [Rhodobacteraceae bacterium MBR-64]